MDIISDHWDNEIYITDERWEHIYERHPEIVGHEELVLKTLHLGKRKQLPLDPNIFKYSTFYDNLPEDHTQIVVVVKFGQKLNEKGQVVENNFVITAYMR